MNNEIETLLRQEAALIEEINKVKSMYDSGPPKYWDAELYFKIIDALTYRRFLLREQYVEEYVKNILENL